VYSHAAAHTRSFVEGAAGEIAKQELASLEIELVSRPLCAVSCAALYLLRCDKVGNIKQRSLILFYLGNQVRHLFG
jgi:hypothetical protein